MTKITKSKDAMFSQEVRDGLVPGSSDEYVNNNNGSPYPFHVPKYIDLGPHGFPEYAMWHDGRVWSDKRSRFLMSTGKQVAFQLPDGSGTSKNRPTLHRRLYKCFINDVPRENKRHIYTHKGSELIVTRCGRIWNCKHASWITLIKHGPSICFTIVGNSHRATGKRIIAEQFVANPHHYSDVRCIDGDEENLSASNLEWVPPSMFDGGGRNRHVMATKRAYDNIADSDKRVVTHLCGGKYVIIRDGRVYSTVTQTFCKVNNGGLTFKDGVESGVVLVKTLLGRYFTEHPADVIDLAIAGHSGYLLYPDDRLFSVSLGRFLSPVRNSSDITYQIQRAGVRTWLNIPALRNTLG